MSPFVLYTLWSLVALAAIFAVSRLLVPWLLGKRGVYLRRRTMFGPALVFVSQDEDGTDVRLLNVGGAFQSATYTDEELRHELVCVYHRHFAEVMRAAGLDQGRAVVMGGGGYSFPRWLGVHTHMQVEAVEIDPAVTELAREFFYLDDACALAEGRLVPVCDDAWHFLQATDTRYDLVVNDAFSRNKPLGPMATAPGARIIHERLAEGGLYLANVIAPLEGAKARVLHETLAVFAEEFAHVYLIPERPEEPSRPACNVMVACDRALDLTGIDGAREA